MFDIGGWRSARVRQEYRKYILISIGDLGTFPDAVCIPRHIGADGPGLLPIGRSLYYRCFEVDIAEVAWRSGARFLLHFFVLGLDDPEAIDFKDD